MQRRYNYTLGDHDLNEDVGPEHGNRDRIAEENSNWYDTGNEKNSTSQIKTSVEGLANGIQKQKLGDRRWQWIWSTQ